MLRLGTLAAFCALALPSLAFADDTGAVTGGAGGAVAGAVVGGPVGAVVGGAAGAIVGGRRERAEPHSGRRAEARGPMSYEDD